MTYELAKELKDVGFPFIWNYEPEALRFREYPTLSELIEACIGEYWFSLVELKPHAWRAEGKTLELKVLREVGKTPEEAVAKLYLALNKK